MNCLCVDLVIWREEDRSINKACGEGLDLNASQSFDFFF
jgi:hypothetical protein